MAADNLLRTLQRLETELHRAETRRNTARLEALLHPAFEEFGRSGRRYSRPDVIAEFQGEKSELAPVHAQDFQLAELGAGIVLLTYRSAHVDADAPGKGWRTRELLWGTNYERFWPHLAVWRQESLVWWIVTQQNRKRREMRAAMADPKWAHIRFVRLSSRVEIEAFILSLCGERAVDV